MTARTEGLTCGPELNLVCVCNGRFYGGGFNPTNDARPDDGYMDVLIVSGCPGSPARRPHELRQGQIPLLARSITFVPDPSPGDRRRRGRKS